MYNYNAFLNHYIWIKVHGYPTTQGPPTTTVECTSGDTKVENCYAFYCANYHWQRFEFTATEQCCLTSDHPKCKFIILSDLILE